MRRNQVADRTVVLYKDEDKHRIGHCNFKPQNNDICIATGHSGDCFNDYIVIRMESGKLKKIGEFSAYTFGTTLGQIEEEKYHLLLANQKVKIDYLEELVKINQELDKVSKKEKELSEKQRFLTENLRKKFK